MVRVEEVAGLEVVVLGERVGEAVALQDQLVALVLEELAPGEGDQHHDQGDVEGEVPRLAQIALLGGDGVTDRVGAEAALPQQLQRGLADLLRLRPGAPGGVRGQPAQAPGGARRTAAQLAHELPGARHDAADEGDEQQDVDRGEPHRAVHVEEAELVVEGPEDVVLAAELLDLHGVDALLRDQRPRDGAQRQQQEQQQRHPHRGELPPEPAGPADDAEGGEVRGLLLGGGGQLGAGGAEVLVLAGCRGPVRRRLAGRRFRSAAHRFRSLQ